MLFSRLCKNLVNNVTFVGLRGAITPPAGSAPGSTLQLNRGLMKILKFVCPNTAIHFNSFGNEVTLRYETLQDTFPLSEYA